MIEVAAGLTICGIVGIKFLLWLGRMDDESTSPPSAAPIPSLADRIEEAMGRGPRQHRFYEGELDDTD